MLPFMKLGVDRKTGLNRFLISWKSADDPGTGKMTYKIDPTGFPQLFLYKDKVPLWRVGSWTGERWSGVPEMTPNFIFNISFVNDEDEVWIMYGVKDPMVFSRMVLEDTGHVRRTTWQGEERRWFEIWNGPKEECDSFRRCGSNSNCDPYQAEKFVCECFPGFEPRSEREWYLRDGSGGCVRKRNVSTCGSGEGFVGVARVKVPDTSKARVAPMMGMRECRERCLRDCTCAAYTSANESSESGCLTWHGDMEDTRTYTQVGQTLYVRVDALELGYSAKCLRVFGPSVRGVGCSAQVFEGSGVRPEYSSGRVFGQVGPHTVYNPRSVEDVKDEDGLMAGGDLDVTAMLAKRAKDAKASGKVPSAKSALRITRDKPSPVIISLADQRKRTGTSRPRQTDQNVETDQPGTSLKRQKQITLEQSRCGGKRQKQITLEQSGCGGFAIPAVVAGSNFLAPAVQSENLVSPDLATGGGLQYLEVSTERLQTRLKEAEAIVKEALAANAKATESADELKKSADGYRREADDLKLSVQRMKVEVAAAAAEIARLTEAHSKLKAEATEKILEQHDAGFQQAVRQAQYFCEIPVDFNFDVSTTILILQLNNYKTFSMKNADPTGTCDTASPAEHQSNSTELSRRLASTSRGNGGHPKAKRSRRPRAGRATPAKRRAPASEPNIRAVHSYARGRVRLSRPNRPGIRRDRKYSFRLSFEDSTDLQEFESTKNSDLPFFDLNSIAAATDNFSDANKLGQGGFGSVYKGLLSNGLEIAVKRLSKYSGQGIEEFKNEVVLISKLQHRNLVRILGCCIQGQEKMLIYEYLPNKSLDSLIFDEAKRSQLDWSKRFDIICGIARGILYLHQDSRLRIIHRDLKASNVLLDSSLNPKIADFGMARIFGGDQVEANTNRVVGTYGYMSPEYAMEGQFSIKSDVYSFGVLLLEIITGRKNSGQYEDITATNLVGHIWDLWREGKTMEIVDEFLGDSCCDQEVQRCIQIGLLCVQDYAVDRPSMSAVVFMLGNDSTLPAPKQPAFIFKKTNYESSNPSTSEGLYSVNDVSITMIDAR
uniref:non-specific serine/threonine protein kinase n=1 Tax=Cajanus cajan TaxID=3821 RepID=A0A151RDZ2_CAJCA|nr:Cysteine-rich receptor-like protein kinase 10 [Cajanus cajan]